MPQIRTAQTSTEAKKAYKKNGPTISERTNKQLQRGYELEQRAAREREAEKRRKLAKEKREERERKEKAIRQQLGVGLATQLIGYSHTQANLKKGMEAFLGVDKKKQEEARQRKEKEKLELELAKKLAVIAQDFENELFDDDEDMEDIMLGLPDASLHDEGSWVDDELDDDTLLEVHDFIMSDPADEPAKEPRSPPYSVSAPPTNEKQIPESYRPSTQSHIKTTCAIPQTDVVKEDSEFIRTHGPVNRTVESALEKLPGEIIELLSQDVAADSSRWAPADGLLYKLNPIGLPPHRLRIKVGCVVVCLRDLNTSSQLSKSQHVRILRVESERLECLTLDGQLAGTKTVITRVPFPAKYRNDDHCPFTRTQYPVRVATDYILTETPRESVQTAFRLPSMAGRMGPPASVRRPILDSGKTNPQTSTNPSFKLPGVPASRARASVLPKAAASAQHPVSTTCVPDSWDDFLESSTQIARELSAESTSPTSVSMNTAPWPIIESLPPLSTQDLDFSLDDLNNASTDQLQRNMEPAVAKTSAPKSVVPLAGAGVSMTRCPLSVRPGPLSRTANIRRVDPESNCLPAPHVRSSKHSHLKIKRPMAPPSTVRAPVKRSCVSSIDLVSAPPSIEATTTSKQFSDFGMSTQEVTCFFDDDDDFTFGSPPIAV